MIDAVTGVKINEIQILLRTPYVQVNDHIEYPPGLRVRTRRYINHASHVDAFTLLMDRGAAPETGTHVSFYAVLAMKLTGFTKPSPTISNPIEMAQTIAHHAALGRMDLTTTFEHNGRMTTFAGELAQKCRSPHLADALSILAGRFPNIMGIPDGAGMTPTQYLRQNGC